MSPSVETTNAGRPATEGLVVGVDGSEGAERALLWAASEARLRGARLRVVLAWEPPVQILAGGGWVVPTDEMLARHQEDARARLDELLAPHAETLAGLEVERLALHGAPATVLLEQAQGADALVVGTRGHGGFVGLLLGSVSAQCAHHAPCPVVIVPAAR